MVLDRFDLRHARGVTRHLYGVGAIASLPDELGPLLVGRRVFALTSRPVLALHGDRLGPIRAAASAFDLIEVADGEAAKTVAEAERIWRQLAVSGGKRDSLILAFGGGSVSDLTGFVAGAFLRGVDWLGLPTTLLAQVDAAIGGKTAVDLAESKNAVGLFHQPLAVAAEPELLTTLSATERRSGLVEAIKVAAALDAPLFDRIELDLDRLLAGEQGALAPVVAAAARLKAQLVEGDPEELGARKLLNLGHTLGHAIEAEIGYGRMAHGDAVAHGCRFALVLAAMRGGDAEFRVRFEQMLERALVPPLPELAPAALLERLARDKKARESSWTWVLPLTCGRAELVSDFAPEAVESALKTFLRAAGERPL